MQVVHVFSGSALSRVDAAGRVDLPGFVRATVERRGDARRIVLGVHDRLPCLTAHDPGYGLFLHAEIERRRLRDGEAGEDEAHEERAYAAFGLAEEAAYAEDGRIRLPELIRECGRIDDLALFVGTGGRVEIWNPQVARRAGGPMLRRLAEYRLRDGPAGHRRGRKA